MHQRWASLNTIRSLSVPLVSRTFDPKEPRITGTHMQVHRPTMSIFNTMDFQKSFFSTDAVQTGKPQESEVEPSRPQSTALPVAFEDSYYKEPHYHSGRGDPSKRAYAYVILGTGKFIAASVIRVMIIKLLYTMSAAADVLALGSVEVDLTNIKPGQNATVKWRGKPVFIRHRTEDEIALARRDDNADMRDPAPDVTRSTDPKWMILLGVCTHLGCVPIANAGEYHGWFCPCHGSHYDLAGRIRKGPAPLNLEIPEYKFLADNKVLLG